ncbi:MAG: aminotransferase class V-fold PLP-dependent enzyme [Armatimonadetes bacterium]|nr:MAG: aminotransferase class V-fold PLP-dependent enzyme [Armatimonadota bacterium]GIV02566.1 MAG: isopenicillin-N epimerase [Fimbriimonadales bacterium]
MLTRRELLAATVGAVAFKNEALDLCERLILRLSSDPSAAAEDEDFWIQIQQAFTLDRSMVNLNNGGVCPSPRVVLDALKRQLDYSNQAPSYYMWRHLEDEVEAVRQRLARHFGCDKEEIAVTRNASEALEICLFGFDLKPGDEVLTTTQDYPRMVNTLKQRERRDGIVLRQVEIPVTPRSADEVVSAIEAGITNRTRLLLICHVIFLNGTVLPVRRICELGRARGIPVVVDGAHAFAHLAFSRDDLRCDYYGTSLHKWLMAPIGTGFLYVRRDKIRDLWPLMAAPAEKDDDIRKFEEIGTHPAANHNAVAEALTFHELIGPERKEARLRFLRDRWANRLRDEKNVRFHTSLDPEFSCGLTTVEIVGIEPSALVEWLWKEHRIFVVAIQHEQFRGIRVTPNVYTTLDELDRFADAMLLAARKGIG